MLTIPPARMAYEAARAAEIQAADRAMRRERILWYFAGLGCVLGGMALAALGLHAYDDLLRAIWFSTAILLGEVGPIVILVIALHREEM